MTTDDFYAAAPSARASWRLAILMGRNARTYKFALGSVLLHHASQGHTEIPLRDLAAPYAMAILERRAPQAPQSGTELGATDFLTVAAEESAESRRLGHPTDRLTEAAERSMPGMVMEKFHNHGGGPVPHSFYDIVGRGRGRTVRLSSALGDVARSYELEGLRAELDARWSIVESSFATGIGRSLIEEGVRVDRSTLHITDLRRRRPVTGVAEAVAGFQHGRCHICDESLDGERPAVDHVFPHALMRRYASVNGWHGPDLDSLWNLAVAHPTCNGEKSDRMPTPGELTRLARRNEAIMHSPVPLHKTLRLTLRNAIPGRRISGWRTFLHEVEKACA
ncbi:HNH endonuclease [Streptomyces albofaciens JCM 4342]|uniref:HNH endonuclease n=1 Tax=Streptomyces albofaciens TaxID=66866 RepID=UPI00123A948D|nr:HNH endonuclease domain-containing protein [Streptomyces albofaciens]KAA6213863.1 HNH endonuclease [Streptomyces albofaciens JCM 4342]